MGENQWRGNEFPLIYCLLLLCCLAPLLVPLLSLLLPLFRAYAPDRSATKSRNCSDDGSQTNQDDLIRMTVSDGLIANHSGPELLSSISDLSGPRASQKIDVRWLGAFPSPMSIQVRAMVCAKDSTAVAFQPGWCISGCALAGVSFCGQSRAMSVLLQIMPAFGW